MLLARRSSLQLPCNKQSSKPQASAPSLLSARRPQVNWIWNQYLILIQSPRPTPSAEMLPPSIETSILGVCRSNPPLMLHIGSAMRSFFLPALVVALALVSLKAVACPTRPMFGCACVLHRCRCLPLPSDERACVARPLSLPEGWCSRLLGLPSCSPG